MIRVLHLYRRFLPDFTGDGLYYLRLIPEMVQQATQHRVLATETRGPAGGQTLPQCRVDYLSLSDQPASAWALFWWIWRHAAEFDVLHIHSHVDRRFLSYALARLLGKQVIFSCTLDDSAAAMRAGYKALWRPLATLLMRSINVFVAISPRLYLSCLDAVTPARVRYIPQGIEDIHGDGPWPDVRSAVRQALGVAPDDLLLLTVGSISDRKNTLFLVDVLARLPNPRVKLVLVGPVLEPAYAERVRARIAELGVADRVIEVGFEANPARYYQACDVFVFASKSEGFCNVYLEAMCHALPVVTCYLPGLTDYVFDAGRTGAFASSVEGFVRELTPLLDDPATRQRMGQAARAEMLRQYTLERIATRYVSLYRAAAPRPKLQRRGGAAPSMDAAEATEATEAGVASEAAEVATIASCAQLRAGPALLKLKAIPPPVQPTLLIVVDTESEFDWYKGTSDDRGHVEAVPYLAPVVERLIADGAPPCLVLDHPVATGAASQPIVRALAAQGAELGVHLQPWTTPPYGEPVDAWHSYCGNLAPSFEAAKLRNLKRAVESLTAAPVRTFKAGRYGAGSATFAQLRAQGLDIDLSICPGYDLRADGGPDWSGFGAGPAWLGEAQALLSLPTTAGFTGPLAAWANLRPRSARARALLQRFHLARLHRLSPEGNPLPALTALTAQLLAQGQRVVTLSFHSPTLKPGCTPYARDEAEVQAFIERIRRYVDHFRTHHGGRVVLPSVLADELRQAHRP